MTRRKQLVVNADDFGFTPDVNEGIVEAHLHGILTATTLMANGAFPFNHPNYIGVLGMHGKYSANIAMQKCDVLISAGARLRREW